MKKFIFILLLSLSSLLGYSQLTEDFESAPDTPDALGVWTMNSGNWLVKDNRTNTNPNWRNVQLPHVANSGSRAAFINTQNLPGVLAEEWLITPQRVIAANSQLRFFTKQTIIGDDNQARYQIRASASANQDDLTAYTLVKEYTETELSTITATQLDYEEKIIDLPFTGARYIAFVKVSTQPGPAIVGDRWLVDDVKIVEKCLEPKFLDVITTTITATTTTLQWTAPSASYTTFQVQYGPAGFVLDVPAPNVITSPVFTSSSSSLLRSYPATGLVPSSPCQYYVRSICQDSNSAWEGPFNWNTDPLGMTCAEPIEVTPLPYSDTSNTSVYGNNINGSTTAAGCGATAGYLASSDVVYKYVAAADGNLYITMDPHGATNTGVFVYANACSSIGGACLGGVGNTNSNIRIIPSVPVTTGQTIYVVISSTAATTSFPYTLNIQYATSCPQPTGLGINSVGPTSATATWSQPTGSATAWEIAVQTAGSAIPVGAGTPTTQNTGYTFTTTLSGAPLEAAKSYQYWVRNDCGGGIFSPWSGPFLFDTSVCPIADKCNYTFTLTDTGTNGWEGGRMQVIQNGLIVATLGATITNGGPTTVTVPLCNNVPFDLFWSVGGDAPDEIRISIKNSFNQQIYAMTTNSQTLIGTTLYTGTVDCINPLCLPPTGLAVPAATVTFNTARINWTVPVVAPLGYEIYVVTQGSPAPTASSTPTYTTNAPPPFNILATDIPGLSPDTNYTVYIRSVCSANGPSIWTPGINFKTKERCFKPTLASLTATEIGTNTVKLGWTNVGTATAWEVIVLPAGSPTPLPTDPWITAPTNPFIYTPTTTPTLNPDTPYVFYVRSNCGGADGYSSIVGPKAFTTLPTCFKPTSPTVPAAFITTTTARVTWVKGQPTDTQWQILLIPAVAGPTGPVAPAAPTANPDITNGTLSFITNTDSPFDATGLASGTIYYCYIRTICSPTDSSNWTPNAVVFNTLICDPVNKCNYKFVLTNAAGNSWNNGRMQVRQNGIVIATLGAAQVNGAPVSVALCTGVPFDLFWNTAGTTPNDLGVSIQNPFLDVIFTKAPNEGTPLTILYNSTANCTPAACSKPTDMTAVTTTNSATLSWTDNSTPAATQYALYIVPTGGPAPTNNPSTPATISPVGNPYELTLLNGAPLTPSTSYTYYVKTLCGPGQESNWTSLTPTIFVTKPLNDECLTAKPVPVNSGQTCLPANTVSSTTLGATASLPILSPPLAGTGCGQANNDVWFSFVAQAQSQSLNFSNLVATPSTATINHSVFSGACGNLTKLSCSTALNSSVTGLTVGETYFIRVYNASTTANQSVNFDLCITSPPANDNCDGAIDVPVNPNQICTLVTLGNTLGATPSLPAGTGANCGTTDDDVWFKFVATNNIHIINTSNNIVETPSTATIAINHSLWSGSCTGGLVNLYCSAGPDSVATGLTIGDTYYIRAYSAGSTAGQSATFDVCVKTPPPPATNNECATAIPLTVNPSSTCNSTTPGNIIGATASLPAPTTCVGNANDDVWFSFVALSPRHFISLLNVEGTTQDLNHAVYSGTCGALTLKYCSAANSLQSNNATFVVGQTYYIRVWSNSAASQVATFDICVKSVSTCQNAQPFCGSSPTTPYIFENTTGILSTGQIACLGSNPNPTYYTLHVGETGPLAFNILQNTVIDAAGNPTGTTLDVDFVAWGPFTSTQACQQIAFVDCPTCPFDNFPPTNSTFYPLGNIIDCSYSGSFTETLSIPNAQQDEYYVILITNFSDDPGFIKLVQTNFDDPAAGETICCSVGLGPDKSVCDPTVTLNALQDPDDPNNVPSTFEWYYNGSTTPIPGETGALLTVSQSGTYKVTGACGLNPVQDEILVTFNVTPTPVVTITQPTCAVLTGTVEVTAPVSPTTGIVRSNLFISEVTDEPSGSTSPSLSYVELFNGTGAAIDLSNYKLKVYTNGATTANGNVALSGMIANNATKILRIGTPVTDPDQGGVSPALVLNCTGVNTDDSIVLTTSTDVVVDVWGVNGTSFTPLNAAGYDYRRDPAVVAPSTTWNAADWTVVDWNATTLPDYTLVGSFPASTVITYQYNIDGGTWQTSTTFSNVAVGSHVVNVKDITTGCTSSLNITIQAAVLNPPVTTISYTTPVCKNVATISPDTSATGFTTNGTYTANPSTLLINPSTGVVDVAGSAPGTYTITYTVLADLPNCIDTGHTDFSITIDPVIVPDFAQFPAYCPGAVVPALPDHSPNGVAGVWSPAAIDPDTIGTQVITFTPNANQCASVRAYNVVISVPTIDPTFNIITSFCSGTTAPVLPASSNNGITGSWSPATVSNTADGAYVFTPNPGQCAILKTINITVTAPTVVPTFNPIASFCAGTAAPALPAASTNGITGDWLPAIISNTQTDNYVFTPTPGQCALPETITVTVTAPTVVPTFNPIAPFCSGTAAPSLPATSTNGITGDWLPATINNTQSGNYVFTPTPGQCALPETITTTVTQYENPDFVDTLTLCSGATAPALQTTSPNGLIGTWAPGVIDPVVPNSYVFTVTPITDRCFNQQTLTVTIADNPVFAIVGGCLNGNYLLTVTSDSDFQTASYIWKDVASGNVVGTTNPLTISQVGNYSVEVTYQGCSATKPYNATTISCTIQKGISPKGTGVGDNSNDFLDLVGQNVAKLEIFNRYGSKVYSKTNYTNEWYGQTDSGDELPDGTYFYVIERNGEQSKTGWIYINHEK